MISGLSSVLAGRQLDLKGGGHPNQVISSSWRTFSSSLTNVVDELEAIPFLAKPETSKVTDSLRQLTYDATEVFDAYAQLLIDRLGPPLRADKSKFQDYRRVVKRLRDPWALICNKFKHAGAQIAFIQSITPGAFSARFMMLAYKNGDSLVRDDEIHRGMPSGICIIKATQELTHALLRVDYQATAFAASLTKQSTGGGVGPETILSIGASLRRLLEMQATVLAHESDRFDGLELESGVVRLVRRTAHRLPTNLRLSTSMSSDGHTKSFSFM